jgi:biotin synthase
VGEDADVIVTSFCADVLQTEWVFKIYIKGFKQGEETPRWRCPPAVMRTSCRLLLTVHRAQHERGMSLPSEAVNLIHQNPSQLWTDPAVALPILHV